MHGEDLAANDDLRPARKFFLARVNDRLNFARDAAEVAAFDAAENVDDRLDVVV